MKIFRVINKDGKGFYQSWSGTPPVSYWYPLLKCSDCATRARLLSILHPTIETEIDKKMQFAFKNLDDLVLWFPIGVLHSMNGEIIEVTIDECHVEEHPRQVLYNPDHVISTETFPKEQLYKDWSFPDDEWWMWK